MQVAVLRSIISNPSIYLGRNPANIIAEALAADEDILIPRHLGSLARSCKVIKEAVKDAKDKLKVEYDAARALVGFEPSTDLGTGPERFVAWYRDYYQV